MATNFFFRNQDFTGEINLFQDLTDEMIKIFGIDVIYLPRSTPYVDPLFLEAPSSRFEIAIPIEMYIKTYDGFQGEGDLLTKFGLSIADKLVLSVSRRRFAEDIGSVYELIRPREGDLIYFPFTKGIFEIKFVEHEASFYQVGNLNEFELQLEKFNYNSEVFNTGIPDIDSVQQNYSQGTDNFFYLSEDDYNITTEDEYDIVTEEYGLDTGIDQNDEFQTLGEDFIDFSVKNPFSEVI